MQGGQRQTKFRGRRRVCCRRVCSGVVLARTHLHRSARAERFKEDTRARSHPKNPRFDTSAVTATFWSAVEGRDMMVGKFVFQKKNGQCASSVESIVSPSAAP